LHSRNIWLSAISNGSSLLPQTIKLTVPGSNLISFVPQASVNTQRLDESLAEPKDQTQSHDTTVILSFCHDYHDHAPEEHGNTEASIWFDPFIKNVGWKHDQYITNPFASLAGAILLLSF
jgi:hypothetical protein